MASFEPKRVALIDRNNQVDGNITLAEAHDIADAVEESIKSKIVNVYDIVVHVEPKDDQHAQEKFGVAR